jgi:hypothetical protein
LAVLQQLMFCTPWYYEVKGALSRKCFFGMFVCGMTSIT